MVTGKLDVRTVANLPEKPEAEEPEMEDFERQGENEPDDNEPVAAAEESSNE